MRTRRTTEVGLLALAAAFILALVSYAMPYVWDGIVRAVPGDGGSPSLRGFWIPVIGLSLDAGIVLLGLLGFALVWRGRWELGPEYASRSGLAVLAFVIALAAYSAYAVTGGMLGFVSGVAFLAPWHELLGLAGAVSLALALYWILANLPVPGSRPAAAVALALSVVGAALLVLDLGFRRAETRAVQGAGYGLSLASVVLWLVLCAWTSRRLRQPGAPSPPASAARGD
jgi:hypothetical protein